jgi:hypothetical protein
MFALALAPGRRTRRMRVHTREQRDDKNKWTLWAWLGMCARWRWGVRRARRRRRSWWTRRRGCRRPSGELGREHERRSARCLPADDVRVPRRAAAAVQRRGNGLAERRLRVRRPGMRQRRVRGHVHARRDPLQRRGCTDVRRDRHMVARCGVRGGRGLRFRRDGCRGRSELRRRLLRRGESLRVERGEPRQRVPDLPAREGDVGVDAGRGRYDLRRR